MSEFFMKIYVKIKFNSNSDKIESFGDWRYLAYMKMSENDPNAKAFFINMLSRFLGANPKNIKSTGKKLGDSYIFEV